MKKYKPTTPGRRGMTSINYRELLSSNQNNPLKSKTRGKTKRAGRNGFGRITTRHQGGGHKKRFRDIDFKMEKLDIPFKVATVEYDPNRSGFIGVASYADGEKRYVLLPQKVKVGSTLVTKPKAPLRPGNRMLLKNIPIGTFVYNVEIKPGQGAKLVRSAGVYAEVLAKDAGYVDLKMPSSEVRKINEMSYASVGEVSNPEKKLVNLGKAGRSRWMNVRPTVRGRAQNPVDHPMGGGEGRSRGNRKRIKTKWGKSVGKGEKTRTPKKYSNKHIVSRRKVGKRR